MAERQSATEATALKLKTNIEELDQKEQRALDKLERARKAAASEDREKLRARELGQALVELSSNNAKLRAKVEQLHSIVVGDERMRAKFSSFLSKHEETAKQRGIPEIERTIAMQVTDALVSRVRARRDPVGDRGNAAANVYASRGDVAAADEGSNIYSPTRIEHHDVLLIAPTKVHSPEEFYRFPVVKAPRPNPPDGPESKGQYLDKPELLDAFDYGQRRALSVARPQDWGPASVRATQRGPAFSTLPLKPEPNSAAGGAGDSSQCYLINTQNLNFRNAWTAEEWNDTPGGVDLPPAPSANHNELEALLAGPQGKVFRLVITSIADWKPDAQARIMVTTPNGERELGTVESVYLGPHMEVWHQLRGGTAMGRVYFNDTNGPRVIPLVNITTLTRE